MNRTDLAAGAIFLLLGAYVLISSFGFPAGMGPLPGPGFFPAVIGAAILVFALALAAAGLRGAGAAEFRLENRPALAVTVALLAGCLLLWDVVPFAARNLVFVVLFLRFLGQGWRTSLIAGAVMTGAVLLAFQYGLRIDLG